MHVCLFIQYLLCMHSKVQWWEEISLFWLHWIYGGKKNNPEASDLEIQNAYLIVYEQRMRWSDGITNSTDMSLASSGSWWWTGKPAMLHFMGSQRVGHVRLNWAGWLSGKESACNAGPTRRSRFEPWVKRIPWRRAWLPTPVFLPEKSHR